MFVCLTVSVFRPSCSISYDTSGNTVFRCSHDSEGEAIQTIRYSINGAAERTGAHSILIFSFTTHNCYLKPSHFYQGLPVITYKQSCLSYKLEFNSYTREHCFIRHNPLCISLCCVDLYPMRTLSYSHTASSVFEFQINVDDLQVGDNIIALTFVSTSGSSVTRIFTVRKVQIITFSPSCSVTSQSDGTVAFTCSGGSDSIQSIRYSINGGSEVTSMWFAPS